MLGKNKHNSQPPQAEQVRKLKFRPLTPQFEYAKLL